MKVKIFIETEIEANVPEKFSPITTNTEWWRDGTEEMCQLAEEMWALVNVYGKVSRVENDRGEQIMEA